MCTRESYDTRNSMSNTLLLIYLPPNTKLQNTSISEGNGQICENDGQDYVKVIFRFSLRSDKAAMDKSSWHLRKIPKKCVH